MKDKKKPKSKDNILSFNERKLLLDAIKTKDEELIVKGLLFTGMRISEFIHMRKDWFDFRQGLIRIPRRVPCKCTQECRNERYRYYKWDRITKKRIKLKEPKLSKPANTWQGKTKQAERPIPIIPEVDEMFKKYFKRHNSIMSTIQNRIDAWRSVRGLAKRAKIGHKVFPHAIRATFSTILVEKGLSDPIALTQIMGWTDIKMAQVYIKLGGITLRDNINLFCDTAV